MRATRMTLKYLTTMSKSPWKQGHHLSLGAEYNSLYRHRTSNRGASKRPRVSGVFPPHHSACTEAPLTEVGHIWRSGAVPSIKRHIRIQPYLRLLPTSLSKDYESNIQHRLRPTKALNHPHTYILLNSYHRHWATHRLYITERLFSSKLISQGRETTAAAAGPSTGEEMQWPSRPHVKTTITQHVLYPNI